MNHTSSNIAKWNTPLLIYLMLPPETQDNTVLENQMTVNYELERMWKEAKWLSWENNKILSHNRQQPDNNFKRGIPQIGVRNVGTWANILSNIQLTKV